MPKINSGTQLKKSTKIRINDMTMQQLLDAKVMVVTGTSIKTAAKKINVSPSALKKKLDHLDSLYSSKLPSLQLDHEMVKATIMEKLEPIREELSGAAIEIVRLADKKLIKALKTKGIVKLTELSNIADTASKRMERMTGIDKGSDDGKDDGPRNINVQIVKMMGRFLSPEQLKTLQEKADRAKSESIDI